MSQPRDVAMKRQMQLRTLLRVVFSVGKWSACISTEFGMSCDVMVTQEQEK